MTQNFAYESLSHLKTAERNNLGKDVSGLSEFAAELKFEQYLSKKHPEVKDLKDLATSLSEGKLDRKAVYEWIRDGGTASDEIMSALETHYPRTAGLAKFRKDRQSQHLEELLNGHSTEHGRDGQIHRKEKELDWSLGTKVERRKDESDSSIGSSKEARAHVGHKDVHTKIDPEVAAILGTTGIPSLRDALGMGSKAEGGVRSVEMPGVISKEWQERDLDPGFTQEAGKSIGKKVVDPYFEMKVSPSKGKYL